MKASVAPSLLAVFLLSIPVLAAAQTTASPYSQACGANPANFSVKHLTRPFVTQQVPAGKALVYVIESMPGGIPFLTEKVNIGLDGSWLGATAGSTYLSFTVDPGVHHLCAVYQGQADPMGDQDQTLLLHLGAEPGKIYYLRYHAFFMKDTPGIAFFEPVDEDEGLYLLQHSEPATWKLKK